MDKDQLRNNDAQGRETDTGKKGREKDISHIDQQEGSMDHGELGGNLNETKGQDASALAKKNDDAKG